MKDILKAFDQYLGEEGLSFECVVIGGAALIHLGIITRRTDDVYLLDPDIPEDIKLASISFTSSNFLSSLNLSIGERQSNLAESF